MSGEETPGRVVYAIAGPEREAFLQGLVTNDVRRLKAGLVYAALLTPQGKYLADFLLAPDPAGAPTADPAAAEGRILLDIAAPLADATLRRLAMYKLRAKVEITRTELHVLRGLGPAPADAFPDPRDPALGWRRYSATPGSAPAIDWDAIRVAQCIPESGIELVPEDSYILEAGFERLQGVDFRKGCYVGQEVTARMKHKTELKKGLMTVAVEGSAAPGTEVTFEGRAAGRLFTQSGGRAIAHLRHDRARPGMEAGAARLAPLVPEG